MVLPIPRTIVYHDLQIGIAPILVFLTVCTTIDSIFLPILASLLDSLYNLIDSIFLTFSSPTYPPPNDHAHRTSPIVKQKSPCPAMTNCNGSSAR